MNISFIKKYYTQKHAFSLVELSVVLLVIATLLSTSVIGYKSIISASKVKSNKDSIDAVYKAIGSYLITNKKLPCPASLTLTKGDVNYGNEVRVSGACPSSTSGGVIISSSNTNLAYGMVPTQTLGLPANIAEDSFGTKLSYIIDKRFATLINSAGTNGFEGTDPDATMIQIQELSSSIVLSNAIMVIISHGANKLGGFNSNSTSQNPNPANADELSNISTNFDNIFMRSSNSSSFDDVLLFKNKMQLAVESGFDKMACRSLPVDSVTGKCEASSILTNLSWKKAEYNQELSSSGPVGQQGCPSACITLSPTLYPSRKCGKYGVWGPILYPCKYNSSIICSITGITGIANQSVPYANSPTAIACISGYSGSPTYTCLSSGPASIKGSCTTITCTAPSGIGYSAQSNLPYATGGSGTFPCNSGYTGGKSYTCTTPGVATGIGGSCTAITCTAPSGAGYSAQSNLPYATGGSGTFPCNSGYTGSKSYTCTTPGVATGIGGTCTPTTPPQCSSYTSRSFDNTYSGLGDGNICHDSSTLPTGWYRLTGSYPYLQQQGPYAEHIGNTDAPGFLQFSHPGTIWQTVSGTVGFNWRSSTTNWTSSIQVTNCNGYYVYYLPSTSYCSLAYVSGSTTTYSCPYSYGGHCYTYAGSYNLGMGPAYGSNPPTYTCQEGCAARFGGSYGSYRCSTNSSSITATANVDRYGYVCSVQADTYKTCSTYTSGCYSAYVSDNCTGSINYCFLY